MEQELLLKIGEIESSVKSAHKRLDEQKELIQSIHDLTAAIKAQQQAIEDQSKRLERIEDRPVLPPCQHIADFKKLEKLENEIEEIREKPIKRWDKFIVALITTLAGLIMGYIWGLFK